MFGIRIKIDFRRSRVKSWEIKSSFLAVFGLKIEQLSGKTEPLGELVETLAAFYLVDRCCCFSELV